MPDGGSGRRSTRSSTSTPRSRPPPSWGPEGPSSPSPSPSSSSRFDGTFATFLSRGCIIDSMDRVLVYDGGCGICSFAAGLVGALDRWGRVRRVSLRDPESRRLLAAMDEDARWSAFHFPAEGETTSRGEG